MTLPDFLGIGAPRAGTTWLNTLLASHPRVYTPSVRDEINFFDQYFDRGLEWYESLFPSGEKAGTYKAIGEVTPQYLECEECPERIFRTLPESKLIIMLRHPVNRAYSQYGFFVQRRNYRGSFQDFLGEKPRALERGEYGRYLKRYLRLFDRSQMLALVFEDAVADVAKTKRTLADFLEVAAEDFSPEAGRARVNPSSIPTFQALYGLVAQTGRRFRRWGLEPVVDFVMRTRVPGVLARGTSLPPIDEGLKRSLTKRFEDDFREVEQCLHIDLSSWKT
jgi:hypothetical protein